MALQCNMIQDIRKYETKVVGPFTKRQLICLLIALAYSVPLALLIPLSLVDKILIGSFLAMPGMLCGYIKIDGTPPEVFAVRYIYKYFLTPSKRTYKRLNVYEQELKKLQTENKKKETGKNKITYSKNPEFRVYR